MVNRFILRVGWLLFSVLINQDLPRIPILHAPPVYAQKKALTGWLPNPTSGESWATIFIEK